MRILKKTSVWLTLFCVLMTVLMPAGRIVSADPPGTSAVKQEISNIAKSEGAVTRPASAAPLPVTAASAVYNPSGLLWQVGEPDNSSAEFTVYNNVYSNLTLPLPAGSWNTIPKGMKADVNGTMNLKFNLTAVPQYGVEFSFKVIDASTAIPQLAVFTNGLMSGLIQITGLNNGEASLENTWKQTYRLYIPKEQLHTGQNELKLVVDRGLYADPQAPGYNGDQYLWFEWDYFKLKSRPQQADEPIHGRYVHLGTTLAAATFKYDENAIRHLAPMTKWMGIAYSGNWMRASFWSDTSAGWDPQGRNYLETLRDLNLTPMLNIIGGNWKNNADLVGGTISTALRSYYSAFVSKFGDLYQYAESSNEPGLFGWSQKSVLAIHELMDQERQTNSQPYLKIVAPGWAYWPYNGIPDGWERDAAQRGEIEALSDVTNGHSYGGTGVQPLPGGSLYENLRVYGEADEGFGKEMAMSETGSNDNHSDNTKYGTYAYRFASAFDRELRGDIGYVDHIMQHAAFFNDGTEFGLFDSGIDWNTHRFEDTAAVAANSSEPGETRLKTFRRLAAAYATHGSPLSYEILNPSDLNGKKAYFRAVDTSALDTSAIGASADKILLNFVNFETQPVTMQVRVTMPGCGQYAGERFGPGDTYAAAHSNVQLEAAPDLTLTVTLGAGETVQYILEELETEAPSAPTNPAAVAVSHEQVKVTWNAATDNDRVVSYNVYRDGGAEPVMTIPGRITFYNDYTVAPETEYSYRVQAVDDFGNVSPLTAAVSATTLPMPITPHVAGDPTKFEAEATAFAPPLRVANNSSASGGKVVEQTHAGGLAIQGFYSESGGSYTLTMAYASNQDSKKNIVVNGQKQSTVTLPTTGSWTANITAKQYGITLQPGYNTISFTSAGNGANIDYFKLEEGAYVPVSAWYTVEHDHPYIDYTGFETASNSVSHVTYAPDATAVFNFNGIGVRWRSDIKSDMGSADVYVDGQYMETVVIPQAGLEGENRIVYELTGLEYGLHRIEVKGTDGLVMVHGFQFESYDSTLPAPLADLTVTDIGWNIVNSDGTPSSHTTPQLGDSLIFWAKVKNIGVRPTPLNTSTGLGQITGGAFSVNGGVVSWSDTNNTVIQPGEEVTLTANSSAQGTPRWTVPTIGDFTISFFVNDIWRYQEMNKENNKLSETLSISLP